MDINDFRTVATVLVFLAFVGIVWWAYGPSRKNYFDQASQLPFKDNKPDPADIETESGDTENSETGIADSEQADNNSSDDQKHKGDQA